MLKFVLNTFFLFFISLIYGQAVGLKTNIEFGNKLEINNSIGTGFSLSDSIKKRYGVYISFDYFCNNNVDIDRNIKFNYKHFSINISRPYYFKPKVYMYIKIGPLISYDYINFTETGRFSTWFSYCNSTFFGIGILSILSYQPVFNFPLKLDLILYPTYLFNIKYDSNPINESFSFQRNVQFLNLQIGLSYKFEK